FSTRRSPDRGAADGRVPRDPPGLRAGSDVRADPRAGARGQGRRGGHGPLPRAGGDRSRAAHRRRRRGQGTTGGKLTWLRKKKSFSRTRGGSTPPTAFLT